MYAYTVNNGGLQYVQKPEPTPEPGQVSITVHTAGLGLIDALWTIGAMPSNPDFVPGLEVSGTIRALGEGVNGSWSPQSFQLPGASPRLCAPQQRWSPPSLRSWIMTSRRWCPSTL